MIEQAVILAAGRGTRLGTLTQDRPKSMLPILGRPIMVRVMDRLREAGVRKFIVVIGEREGAAAAYLSTSWYPDADITFAIQPVATGTVDALKLAAPHITGPFVLSAVDTLTSTAHVETLIHTFNAAPGCLGTLSLLPTSAPIGELPGVRINDDRITAITGSPAHPEDDYAAIMLYALDTAFLDYLDRVAASPRGERKLASALQIGIDDGQPVTYTVTDWRLHLTTELDLLAINKVFLQEGRDAHILSEIPGSVHLIPPVRIDPNVSIGQSATIGPNVYVESGATVGDGAVLANALVLKGATVPIGDVYRDAVIARHVRIARPVDDNILSNGKQS